MHALALTLSIISSVLLIVYLLILMFVRRKKPEVTLTIRGRIVTRTEVYSERLDNIGRAIEQR